MSDACFITLEGGEGVGKSTQAKRLADALKAVAITAVVTREPGGAPGAEEIRKLLVTGEAGRWDPLTEAILHFAARRQHLTRTVFPALERGDWVISDRFADSTMAYQGYGLELGRAPIEALYRATIGDFAPDLTFVLDLPVEEGLARASARGGGDDRYERMDLAFHERLRQGFLEIARREPKRCAVIEATASIEETGGAILAVMRDRLEPPGI